MLKAIIFDMDGVIVDSEVIHYEADKKMLKEGFNINLQYDYYNKYIGGTVSNLWKGIIRDFNIQNEDEYSLNTYADKILEKMLEKEGYPAVAGVVPFIKKIKEEYNLKLAVASSSSMSRIKKNLKNLGIDSYFEVITSGQDMGVSKPNPAVFLEAARLLQVSPKECVIIEDSYNGIQAAKNGNFTSLGFINPNSGNQKLNDANAVFEDFSNLDMNFINLIYCHNVGEPAVIMKTKRLIVREITVEDVSRLYEIYDENIIKYMPGLFENIQDEIEYTKSYIKNIYGLYHYGIWVLERIEDGKIIGRAGIEYKEISGSGYTHELGYMIGSSYQNQGYAGEAIAGILSYMKEYYGITDIFVKVNENNEKSMHLAKKYGFDFSKKVYDEGYIVGELI